MKGFGTEACRAQWTKQAGVALGIARSAYTTMRAPQIGSPTYPYYMKEKISRI